MTNGLCKCRVGSAILAFLILIPLNFAWGHGPYPDQPPGAPPGKPPPVVPKGPPIEPKIYKPPPGPPEIGVLYDSYESEEDEAKRLAQEKAEEEARKKADRIKGNKKQIEQSIQEDTNIKIGGQKLPNTIAFAGHSTVIVDQYGYPIRGKLARDSYLWVRLRDIAGRLKSRFVKFTKGTEVTVGTAKDGEDFVVKGTLAGEELLPTPGGGGAWFKQGTEVSLDLGTGTVTTGTLARDTELPVEGEYGKQNFPAGTKVTINPKTGGVVASSPPAGKK